MVIHNNGSPDLIGTASFAENASFHFEPVMIWSKPGRISRSSTLTFEWQDGAGEMHSWILSPEESIAYFVHRAG